MSEKKKILIVEDQADIRTLIRMTLQLGETEIHEAENGDTGWALLNELRPDLVVLDVMMPGGLDGYQMCKKIKSDGALRDIPVILLTARGQMADFEAGRQAGANAYLTKPFSPLELIETVEALLNHGACPPAV
jgi:two-component system, OmpR family, phosphate regulon response regulator PhoB